MTLIESFSQLTDPRRPQGMRTSIEQIFSMVVISNLCGYFGFRPVHNFSKVHSELFKKELGLKHKIPSHVTFRELMIRIDQDELIKCFNNWSSHYVPVEEGDWISGDGKALASTVSNAHNSKQDYQAIVSMFCHRSGLVRLIGEYRNAKKGEREIVISLLEHLRGMGLIIRLDALHTQKNDKSDY
jgi:hypothetical protein